MKRLLLAILIALTVASAASAHATGTIVIVGPHPHSCVNVKLWFGYYDQHHRIHWLQGTAIVCFNRHTVTIREPNRIAQ